MYGSMTPLLTEFLTPDLIGKMGSRAGISDVASVQKTISGAVPAILSGLAHLVSTPCGARQLSSVIASQPSNLLDNLGGMSDGPGQLVNIDNTALSTLFGNTTLGGLSGALWQICWHWRGRCSKPARYGGAYNPRRSPATNWWRH
jgi:hypothetical protein